ncbi:early nodulin-like protein 9 [Magnolia sinica]|uniref:early nodulin-like protein 9 n=1 Tax=Magnolia sinica TaxID=86752 RepID=UPI002659D798|nr:early nodulin-like protein 9 [Magnolia sinica]
MAKPTSRSSDHHRMAFHAVGLFVLSMLVQSSDATEFKVGGANGWTVPADSKAMTLNQWAEMKRFQTGDSLLFVYQADKDSVLQVTEDGYNNCNTASSIASFYDGNTSFKFNQPGSYYFISGHKDRCQKNEKLHVIVMADRNTKKNGAPLNAVGLMGSVGILVGSSILFTL